MKTPITPGEILLEDYLMPMGISQNAMARAIGVAPQTINEIVHAPAFDHTSYVNPIWCLLRTVRRILERTSSRVQLSQTGQRKAAAYRRHPTGINLLKRKIYEYQCQYYRSEGIGYC